MTEKTQGKGRPTPKRNQKARGPVAPPPTNRREAAKQLRAKQAEQRAAIRSGSKAGDDRMFLARDRGPVRGYVRDLVDSQRTLGPFLLPFMVLNVVISFVGNADINRAAFLAMLGVIVIVGVDLVRLGRVISTGVAARFPDEKRRPLVFYGLQRTTLIRRWRTPPARVAVGADV